MDRISIVPYQAEHQPWFEQFNKAWIERYFWLEDVDRYVLEHPEEAIVAKGGTILMALYEGKVAGTVALKKVSATAFEFTKMAVGEEFRRKGIAEALSREAFKKAREMGARKVVLYSQTGLEPAIRLYRKLGFTEVPLEPGIYQRADIKMEIDLEVSEIIN